MRLLVLASMLAVTPAFAGGFVVQKKVTSLVTKDSLTKTDVLMRVPNVIACFDKAQTVTVSLQVKDGKVTKATPKADKKTSACLKKQFADMNVTGTFTATIQLTVKPDPRSQGVSGGH